MTLTYSQLNVLVVDDQEPVRRWVRAILAQMGISQVAEAADGAEALAAVTQPGAQFDLILCDLRMPRHDGIETIRAFASMGIESAIIVMSVEDERIIETAGMLAQGQGLRLVGTIAKPVTAEKLQPLLARMFEVRKQPSGELVLAPEADLRDAFANGQLLLLYQPKVSMANFGFAGVEALVRWRHPRLGLFRPASFVPTIEASEEFSAGLVEFSLKAGIACAGRWRAAGWELNVAINLSARGFDRLDLPERIVAMCDAASVPAEMITLELTETEAAQDDLRLIDVATRLRLKGFTLSIDDFGTGESGLSKLRRLPFNQIKIDRQFANGCATNATNRSVVEASLSLARNLRMTSVAEGVQDRQDWDLLASLGCDYLQGYFIARPMTEEGLEAWAAQWKLRNG